MSLITLIRTAPEFPPGSMAAYAALVSDAICRMKDRAFEVNVCDFFDPAGGNSMRRHHVWRMQNSRRFFSTHPSDLYHLLDGSMAAFLPCSVWKKTIVTVHDLIPLLQMRGVLPGNPGIPARILIHRMVHVLRKVAGVTSVSQYTADDLLKYTGRTGVTVLHNPVRPLPEPDGFMDLPARYLFHVGNNADYKNRSGVLDVFEQLQNIPDLHLILAGPSPVKELRQKAARLQRVRFLVDVSDSELSALYKKASAFLFPSLYEGFGLPVLEAMQAGCPVVCSSVASLPEVAGNAALISPADDIGNMAACCRKLLEDTVLRETMVEKGRQRAQHFTIERLSDSLHTWYKTFLYENGDIG